MKQKIIKTIIIFAGLGVVVFIVTTQILGIPMWWIFRGIETLSGVKAEFEFNILISPDAPKNIGESVLISVLNASSQLPVESAKVSLEKDGTHLLDYYTDVHGQTMIEYVGEVTIIRVSKLDFETAIEAIPHAPSQWVRDQNIALVVGAVSGVAGSLMTYFLQNKKGETKKN